MHPEQYSTVHYKVTHHSPTARGNLESPVGQTCLWTVGGAPEHTLSQHSHLQRYFNQKYAFQGDAKMQPS